MRKVLLTSSAVSGLVSICVVVLFTLALFLSGYTVQQRMLQNLRFAIRPGHTRPSPGPYIPDYFERKTTTLEDGTVVVGRSQADVDEEEWLVKKYELTASSETLPEPGKMSSTRHGAGLGARDPAPGGEPTEGQLRMLRSITARVARRVWGVEHPDPLAENSLPMTKAKRRKLIKEEIQKLAQSGRPVYRRRRLM